MLTNQARTTIATLFLVGFVITAQAKTLTDPTRPPGKSELMAAAGLQNSDTAINVTAVIKKNQVSYVIVNDKWLKKGEKIGEWRVTSITNSGVFLKNENEPEASPLRFLINEKSDFKKQTNNE